MVLLILLTALGDPEQYHLTSAELANDLDVMDDASKSTQRDTFTWPRAPICSGGGLIAFGFKDRNCATVSRDG